MSGLVWCRGCTTMVKAMVLSTAGMRVCPECGEVFAQNELAAEIGFNENSAGSVSLAGTMIGSSSTGLTMSKNGAMFQRGESRAMTIARGQTAVRDLARRLPGFPHTVTTRGCRWFELAVNTGFTKGRTREHVAAACLFLSCRTPDDGGGRNEKPAPYMLMDFSTILKISVFDLGMIYLKLVNKLNFGSKICLQDPSLYIDRWARMLEFDKEDVKTVAEDACHLVMGFQRDWLSEGRRPSGICGAALLLAARMNNYHRTLHEIIQVVKVADVTIKKRLAEFKATASGDLTIEQFRQAWAKGEDTWDSMAQSLPPSKIKNDALEAERNRVPKRKRLKKEDDSDASGGHTDEDEEDESDILDEGEDDDDDVDPGMRSLAAATKKIRQNLRKQRLAKARKLKLESLKQEDSQSRAGSILPGSSPGPAPSERAGTPVPMPNWKMESVEPSYMGKAKEAALRPRRRRRRSSGKGKRPEMGTGSGLDDAGTDKEEGTGADTDKEEGDQTDADEKSDGEGLERMDTDKEEGDFDEPEADLLEKHDGLVENAIEKELADALNSNVDVDESGQKKAITVASRIAELAGKQRQEAQRAAHFAKRDWANGLDEDELEGYILDEAGFEAKKRIWWHNNYEYMIKRYERKQREDGLERPQQTERRKRQRPGPAVSAQEATMNLVKGKGFSRSVNYDAIRRLHEEDEIFSDTEDHQLNSIGPRATSQKPDVGDAGEDEQHSRGGMSQKAQPSVAETDKEEDDKGDDDDKGDEEDDVAERVAVEEEGFEEYE